MRDGTRTRARRSTTTVYYYCIQSLVQFYLPGHGATTFIQINQEKTTLKDKGVRLDLLGLYGVGLGRPNESHETLQVTCTLEVPRWGDPRRLVPTAASVTAVELGPSQGEVIRAPAGNALRGTNGSFYALLELMLCRPHPFLSNA